MVYIILGLCAYCDAVSRHAHCKKLCGRGGHGVRRTKVHHLLQLRQNTTREDTEEAGEAVGRSVKEEENSQDHDQSHLTTPQYKLR